LELRKHMSRPSGCTFLGSKATTTCAGINGVGLDTVPVIVDSGSDITLISHDALQSLSSKPKIRMGQKINLVQVTGNSTISGYVNLDLFFETTEGPVKMNVDAYIVNGMTAPFILGNDFADQYSISILRRGSSSFLSFGDSGREAEVENSTAPSIHRTHRWSQKIRRRQRFLRNRGEVRSAQRVVLPPESSVKVPVNVHFTSNSKELFIERYI
ncbi:hypothetical protein ARMGADRAFT_864912, partial [Armillaria gallica]